MPRDRPAWQQKICSSAKGSTTTITTKESFMKTLNLVGYGLYHRFLAFSIAGGAGWGAGDILVGYFAGHA
jgi:hypothetical protein